MHFDFSANQILWTITFAAELVLLVVLLGRDRARRFPMFTTSIVLGGLLLLVSRLLFGRMSAIASSTVFLVLSDLAAIVGLLVVVEVARRGFAGVSRRAWLVGTLSLLFVAVAILVVWGPWPPKNTFQGGALLVALRSMQLFADKGATLASLIGIELGLAIVLLGRRFQGGWRSHPQQIAIGLSTAAISQLGIRILWQHIASRLTVHSQVDYQNAIEMRDHIYNANNLVYFVVLVWWIVWLWFDEPGTVQLPAEQAETEELPRIE